MNSCDTQFDQGLLNIQHYQYHPEMLPFVGKNYCNKKKRVLLVGESHYVTNKSERNVIEDYQILNWYESKLRFYDTQNVFCEDFENYTTRRILNHFVTDPQFNGSGLFIFSNPIRSYYYDSSYTGKIDKNLIHDFAFINFYQRPAFKFGESLISNEEDNKIACETLNAVIDVISPDIVIFLSRKAYNNFMCKKTVEIYRVPHPTCCWWNRATKRNKKGKETFKEILIEAWGTI